MRRRFVVILEREREREDARRVAAVVVWIDPNSRSFDEEVDEDPDNQNREERQQRMDRGQVHKTHDEVSQATVGGEMDQKVLEGEREVDEGSQEEDEDPR